MRKTCLFLVCLLACLLAVPATAQEPADVNAVLVEYHDAAPFSYPDITGMYYFLGSIDFGTFAATITFDRFALRHCMDLPFGLPPGYEFDVCQMYRPRPYGPQTYTLVDHGTDSWFATMLNGTTIRLDRFDDTEGPYLILRIDEPDGSFWVYDIQYGTPDVYAPRRPEGKRVRR